MNQAGEHEADSGLDVELCAARLAPPIPTG